MPQMRIAATAPDLDPVHAIRAIADQRDVIRVERFVKRRPTRAGLELRLRAKERQTAQPTAIHAGRLVVEQPTAERRLGTMVEQHAALLGGQLAGEPFAVGGSKRSEVVPRLRHRLHGVIIRSALGRDARMDYRTLGRTGLRLGVLGFGCGNVGGLLVRGTPAEQERAVARALELGINYFDTAPLYGDGQSETHLGRVIRTLKPRLYVGTKFRLPDLPAAELPGAMIRSLDESLRRLGLERVDLLQCHNLITRDRSGRSVSVKDLRDALVP